MAKVSDGGSEWLWGNGNRRRSWWERVAMAAEDGVGISFRTWQWGNSNRR